VSTAITLCASLTYSYYFLDIRSASTITAPKLYSNSGGVCRIHVWNRFNEIQS